jgi:nitrogen-specific signal transduction histidine kinase
VFVCDLSIRKRIYISFVILTLSIVSLFVQQHISHNCFTKLQKRAMSIEDARVGIFTMISGFDEALHTEKTPSSLAVIEKGKNLFVKEYTTLLAQQQLLDTQILWQDIQKDTKHILEYEAFSQFHIHNNTLMIEYGSLRVKLERLLDTLEAKREATYGEINEHYDFSENVHLGIYSVTFLVLITIFYSFYKGIISPLDRFRSGIMSFFDYIKDDTKSIKQIEITSQNELGQISKTINENMDIAKGMMSKDKELISNVQKILEHIKDGNFEHRIEIEAHNPSLTELKNSLNEVLDTLKDKIDQEISTQLQQKKMMIQQSKLAIMGEMISMLAHQWRQPLNSIAILVSLYYVKYEENDLNEKTIIEQEDKIQSIIEELSQTLDSFKEFVVVNDEKITTTLDKIIEKAISIIDLDTTSNHITINREYNSIEAISIYPNEISQVIMNLVKNSIDQFEIQDNTNPTIDIEVHTDSKYTYIDIKDNAGGIDEANIDKIFEPYFSTKSKNKRGLGLYMSKAIIDEHHKGELKVTNIDDGAMFSITIPKI